ncbi:MAG TPA: TetR/AcrR family transcriptional regulator [Polyangia bacterium]|nr:TetR/AcrR family transcriptional regulator [Polyangia bacterium]
MPPEKQKEVLDAAAAALAEVGFENAVLNDVLERSGLSKSSFYYYFEDREDLLTTVVERLLDAHPALPVVGGLKRATTETFWPEVKRVFDESAHFLASSPLLIKILPNVLTLKQKSPRMAALQARAVANVRSMVQAGQRLGCVRMDLTADRFLELWGSVMAVLQGWLVDAAKASLELAQIEAHTMLVFDLFRRLAHAEPARRAQKARK